MSLPEVKPAVPPLQPFPVAQEQSRLNFVRTTALMVCVGVSGASVMVYEFIAVRILQRYFGSSLEVWASEISVCLAGLAIGYALGGMLADRFQRPALSLAIALIVSGALAFFIEPIIVATYEALPVPDPAAEANRPLMRWWEPLLVAGVSSFVPLIGLGFVMPTATRLHVRGINSVGTSVGWIAAVSTVGSIVGALLTANYLIPEVGVRRSLYATSTILVIMGVIILLGQSFLKPRVGAALLVAAVFVPGAGAQIIFEDYSAYHHILVQDQGDERVLLFDDDPQTTMSISNPWAGGFEYTDYFHLPLLLNPEIRSVLFVGLGGGTGPKAFLDVYSNIDVQAVEIDPMVIRVARDFFSLPQDPRLNVAEADGRTFIQRTRTTYGAIVMDAYASGPSGAYLPYHLATKEFFQVARQRLIDGGSIVYNIMGMYGDVNDNVVRSLHATLNAVFDAVYVFEASSTANTVFIAQKLEPNVSRTAWPQGPIIEHPMTGDDWVALVASFRTQGIPLPAMLERRVRQFSRAQTAPINGPILTDDKAPVD